MGEKSASSASIEKLNEDDYICWKQIMIPLLKVKGLWETCILKRNTSDKPEDKKQEEEAKFQILSTMTMSEIRKTGIQPTAHDIWAKITENYEGSNSLIRSSASAAFMAFCMIRGEDLLSYCWRFEDFLNRLMATGYIVEEEQKYFNFQRTLPEVGTGGWRHGGCRMILRQYFD